MSEPITYVGIDAHTRELQVAMLIGSAERAISWTSPTDPRAVQRLCRKLEREAPGPIECCYEAGPSGYALQRRLHTARIRCRVIAPSLIPRKPGDRVKTNRRDARKLADLLRANLLTEVQPTEPRPGGDPGSDAESRRCAGRLDAEPPAAGQTPAPSRADLPRTQLDEAPCEWLDQLAWTYAAERSVILDYRLAIAQLDARLAEITRRLGEVADQAPYAGPRRRAALLPRD